MSAANNVIQFEGTPDQPVWISPIEEFDGSTQLVVDDLHEALVLVEGRVKLFEAGTHMLKSETDFSFSAVQGFATDSGVSLPCKVYFVDKAHDVDMRWGTQEVLAIDDPELGIPLHLKIRGTLSFRIDYPIRFVEKFTGFTRDFSLKEAVKVLREVTSTQVLSIFFREINEAQVGYPTISNKLADVSQLLMNTLFSAYAEFGIYLTAFDVESITAREDGSAELQAAMSAGSTPAVDEQAGEEPAESAEPVELAESVESVGFAEPVEQAEPAEFAEQAQFAAPVQYVGFVDSAELADFSEPSGFMDFAEPAQLNAEPEPAPAPERTFVLAEPQAEESQAQAEDAAVPESSKPLTKDEFITRVSELKELLDLGIIDQSDFDQGKKDLLYRFTHN